MGSTAHSDFPRPFGPYALLERIGRGGMGDVYLARRRLLDDDDGSPLCVIKSLRGDLTNSREYVRRFIDEARTVVQLSHQHICQVFDVGRVEGTFYLAMEHVAGKDLRSLMEEARARHIQIPEAVALHIILEVLDALDYAHNLKDLKSGQALGVVHRDVSPPNVLVSFAGETRVIDFGLALSARKVERTEPGVVMGKMAYMSPEQARGQSVDARADVFAAAIIAVELLTGERYYETLGRQQIWETAGKGTFRPEAFGRLAPDLQAILGPALAPDAASRTSSCRAFREALLERQRRHGQRVARRDVRAVLEQVFPGAAAAARAHHATLTEEASHVGESEPSDSMVIAQSPRVLRAPVTTAETQLPEVLRKPPLKDKEEARRADMTERATPADMGSTDEEKSDTAKNVPDATERIRRPVPDESVTLSQPASVPPRMHALVVAAALVLAAGVLLVAMVIR